MKALAKDMLLKERKGALEDCNLWSFWDSLSIPYQDRIIQFFENTPVLFDYTTLFVGDSRNDIYHGAINTLGILFVNVDLHASDLFFKKFSEYIPANYHNSSNWGITWDSQKNEMIRAWERIVKKADKTDYQTHLKSLTKIQSMSIEDIYWVDAHSFVQRYSAVVYKYFLNGECSIERFENAFNFCYDNIDRIKSAITCVYGWDKPIRNTIVEQYLIYLEKNKEFDRCIEIINEMEVRGWRNDFEKRLSRCISKKDNSIK